ncbi:MAG: hypothetical protein V7K38_26945 [Nostoc sp.]|uniref:hypothetical protein n=1 Tax=Nostoc sp. TaxID=1180 RepID=UPI002FF7BAD1
MLRLSAARFLVWLITFSTIASIPKAALERLGFRPIILVVLTIVTLTYRYNSVYTLMSLPNSGFNLEFERRVPKIHSFYEKIKFTASNLATYCALIEFF